MNLLKPNKLKNFINQLKDMRSEDINKLGDNYKNDLKHLCKILLNIFQK